MDPIIISAGTSFVTALITKGAEGPAQTLDDLWYLAGFGRLHDMVERKKAKSQANLDTYKTLITKKVSEIPEKNLQEPATNIVGPALEASKYYIDEEIIREMFANVIAASMDDRRSGKVHQSFVEIIKQLSPLDAQNLKVFAVKNINFPIVNYIKRIPSTNGQLLIKSNVFLENPLSTSIDDNSVSISNLVRVGLISVSYLNTMTKEDLYQKFKDIPLFQEITNDFTVKLNALNSNEQVLLQSGRALPVNWNLTKELSDPKNIDIEKGSTHLTALGLSFTKICIK